MPQLDSAIKPGYSHTSQSHMTIMSLLIQIIEKFWSIAFDQTGATAVTEPGSPNLRKSFRQVHIGSMQVHIKYLYSYTGIKSHTKFYYISSTRVKYILLISINLDKES